MTELLHVAARRIKLLVLVLVVALVGLGVSSAGHSAAPRLLGPGGLLLAALNDQVDETLVDTGLGPQPVTIPILTFSLGLTNPVAGSTRKIALGGTKFEPFSVSRKEDAVGVQLVNAAMGARATQTLVLTITDAGPGPSPESLTITMTNAQISSVSQDPNNESVSWVYTGLSEHYTTDSPS